MSVSSNVYANALDQAFSGNINWASDTIKMALLGSGYTPNLASDTLWSAISANEVSATGYTAGGASLASKTHTVTAANSFGTTWAATTAYPVGAVVRPSTGNGFVYEAVAISGSGTSGGSAPSFPTVVGETVVDNSGANQITWSCIGESIVQWSSAAPSWASSSITADFAVIYDSASGALIAVITFGAPVVSSSTALSVNAPGLGWFWFSPS